MANTYFKIEKSKTYQSYGSFSGYHNNYDLTLTACCGGEDILQLTVGTNSSLTNQSGRGYITLSKQDCLNLIAGLNERINGCISATGDEQSKVCPNDVEL